MVDDVVDLAALLAPIGDAGGAGEDLRQDYSPSSIYQKLRDARAEARAEERQRDSEAEGAMTLAEGWRQVRRLGVESLEAKSKDFEIAAWLTEALVRQEGLAGLAAGARLLAGLLEQHWDEGFPRPDEEGASDEEKLEGRSAPLGGLAGGESDGTIMQALRRAPLFRRPSGESFSLYQYEASADTAGLADEARREQRYAQGVIPLDTIETEARFDLARLRSSVALSRAARQAWQSFQDQCEERFGSHYGPPTRRVAELLDRMIEVACRLGGAEDTAEAVATDGQPEDTTPSVGMGVGQGGSIAIPGANPAGREQALRTLEQLAAYFQKTEPHSFLAYTLADAARRGRMTLPELLSEVLQDDSARTAMLTALGIRPGAMEEPE